MNISSASLFHFTTKIDTLKSIIENDFWAQYNSENFLSILSSDIKVIEKGIPMVCFCDIPLSQIKYHAKVYGSYAIGLSKDWAMENKISPVIYTYTKSDIANCFLDLSFNLIDSGNKEIQDIHDNYLGGVLQYIKPYSGNFKKGPRTYKEKRFYDEREWRFIPKIFDKTKPSWIRNQKESLEVSLPKLNKRILDGEFERAKLKFTTKDIKHLIVKSENDVLRLVKMLDSIKSSKYSSEDIQILKTKITPLDQIIVDY